MRSLADEMFDFLRGATPAERPADNRPLQWAVAEAADAGRPIPWRSEGRASWGAAEVADAIAAVARDLGGRGVVFRAWVRDGLCTVGFDPSAGFGVLPRPAWGRAWGRRWAAAYTWPDAWAECTIAAWLLHAGGPLVPRPSLAAAAAECVALVLPLLEVRPQIAEESRLALAAVSAWADGRAGDADVRAASAAYDGFRFSQSFPPEPIYAVSQALAVPLAPDAHDDEKCLASAAGNAAWAAGDVLTALAGRWDGAGAERAAERAEHARARMLSAVRRSMPFVEVLRGLLRAGQSLSQ